MQIYPKSAKSLVKKNIVMYKTATNSWQNLNTEGPFLFTLHCRQARLIKVRQTKITKLLPLRPASYNYL